MPEKPVGIWKMGKHCAEDAMPIRVIIKVNYRVELVNPRATLEFQDSISEPMSEELKSLLREFEHSCVENELMKTGPFKNSLCISFSREVERNYP